MRKLASIQKISALHPIPNADKIEVASVLGWKVVVRKGEFKVDDLVAYCEIDSILPHKPEFEFLKERNYRIKTIRLRGQISQGICFPLSILPSTMEAKEDMDVTDIIGIEKYIPQIPANIAGIAKGTFPSFIPKTDETRVQVLQNVLTRHKGKQCYVTEKVDGCSATYYLKDGDFGVCSRNLDLKEDDENLFWKLGKEMKIKEKLEIFAEKFGKLGCGENIAIQGELIGLGVQKNNLRLDKNYVLFFNIFFINSFRYADYNEFRYFAKQLDLPTVPTIDENFTLIDNIDDLIKMSIGTSSLNPKVYREGIVIRPLKEEMDLEMAAGFGNGRLSFKAINPEYLLKFGE